MIHVEFLVSRRPLSLQTNSRRNFQGWKERVRAEARKAWGGRRILGGGTFRLTIVHLYREGPPDVDNIIKPIQDALDGVVLSNDDLVSDVDSHRRFLFGDLEFERLPGLLAFALDSETECVYVRLSDAPRLEDVL